MQRRCRQHGQTVVRLVRRSSGANLSDRSDFVGWLGRGFSASPDRHAGHRLRLPRKPGERRHIRRGGKRCLSNQHHCRLQVVGDAIRRLDRHHLSGLGSGSGTNQLFGIPQCGIITPLRHYSPFGRERLRDQPDHACSFTARSGCYVNHGGRHRCQRRHAVRVRNDQESGRKRGRALKTRILLLARALIRFKCGKHLLGLRYGGYQCRRLLHLQR